MIDSACGLSDRLQVGAAACQDDPDVKRLEQLYIWICRCAVDQGLAIPLENVAIEDGTDALMGASHTPSLPIILQVQWGSA